MTSSDLTRPTQITTGAERATAVQDGPAPSRHVSPLSILLAVATPAVTVPMLALSRYWAEHGAKHSNGDMMPLVVGGVMSMAAVKWTKDDSVLTGTCLGVAGACLLVGSMAYPDKLIQPVIATAFATVGGWVLSWRLARENKKADRQFANEQANRNNALDIANIQAHAALGVATIRGETDIRIAQINGATTLGVADRNVAAATARSFSVEQMDEAWQHRQALDTAPSAPTAVESTPEPTDDWYGLPASLVASVQR